MPRKRRNIPYFFLSTTSSKKEAHELSKKILSNKLAACVSVIYPATSFFNWKGKNQAVREAVLLIKTMSSRAKELERFLKKHHSYEVPELIGWPIERGSKAYLGWLKSSTRA